MQNYLPGTVIELSRGHDVTDFLGSLFAAGGLVLSQVLQLTGLSTHTVQNWVKRKYLNPPVNKKYDCNQFCKVAIINMLGGIFSLDGISRLIGYVELLDSDAALHIYTLFVGALSDVSEHSSAGEVEAAINRRVEAAKFYADVKARLRMVLQIMLMAHYSSVYKLGAQNMLDTLDV